MPMPFLIQIVVGLLIVGLLLWVIEQIPAIDPAIRRIIRVVIIVFSVIWLIYALLAITGVGFPALPRR